ncbi:hypothetical protein [Flaviaesturariibacter amylovorans]|uniref:Uncharacterized protein n=1 Tax=Flaviaesturariibacter amylovorans TaxID=1084520 RepID=A0ABP8H4J3_9BACT
MTSLPMPLAGPPRPAAEGGEWADLNRVLSTVLATTPEGPEASIRCEALPMAQGTADDWHCLLRALVQLAFGLPSEERRRYLHIQCQEERDPAAGATWFLLSLHVNVRPPGSADALLNDLAHHCGGLSARLSVQAHSPTHSLFQIHFAGKNH